MNFGAIFGAVGGGMLGDKLNLPRVLAVFFTIAAVSITLLGFKSPTPVLYLLIAIADNRGLLELILSSLHIQTG